MGYAFVGFGLAATVFATLGSAAVAGTVTLTEVALVAQAATVGIWSGDFYPEADVQTQFGMNSYHAVRDFARCVDAQRAWRRRPGRRRPATGPPHGTVRFEGVSFRYPGQAGPVLDGLDLIIPAGRCTAIVGLNGAGKTTLVKLLTRCYDPDRGAVTVDGLDLRRRPRLLARRLASSSRTSTATSCRAGDNIGLGVRAPRRLAGILRRRSAAGPETARRPARGPGHAAAARYTGGVTCPAASGSASRWPARCSRLEHGAACWCSTSRPPPRRRAEVEFFDRFPHPDRGPDHVIISHRFSTVRQADPIAVLADGRLAEYGTHEQPLDQDGRYARMFRLQAARFADAGDVT